jgi:2-polyprenyl-3-methyl-5-hydroxy-6-metoxy-1,4-benzoquinol methylase
MSLKEIKYKFLYIENCNMCNSKVDTHKILGKRLNGSQGKSPQDKIGITTTICKCSNCGLIYSNPQPIPLNIQDHYDVPPEEYWVNNCFLIDDNYFSHEIKRLKTLMQINPSMKSLDIGAGLGKSMISLNKIGFDTYGLEASKPFYEKAISHMNIDKNKLKLGMLEEIEYPENHFDFITFGAVLEHLYDPSFAINKAMKWLKTNGIIHIEVPSARWLTNDINNLYYKLIFKDYCANLSPMHSPFHLYEFDIKSFENHSKLNSYEIVYSEYYVLKTYLPSKLDFIFKPFMKYSNKGMQLCVWLKKINKKSNI